MKFEKIKQAKGFTLIEIMIVVAIMGVLAAIAIPQYGQYVARSNRTAAQAFMMDVASREKQYLLDARSYTPNWALTDPAPNLGMTVPADVSRNYTITVIAPVQTPPVFTVVATPIGLQAAKTHNEVQQLDDVGTKTGTW